MFSSVVPNLFFFFFLLGCCCWPPTKVDDLQKKMKFSKKNDWKWDEDEQKRRKEKNDSVNLPTPQTSYIDKLYFGFTWNVHEYIILGGLQPSQFLYCFKWKTSREREKEMKIYFARNEITIKQHTLLTFVPVCAWESYKWMFWSVQLAGGDWLALVAKWNCRWRTMGAIPFSWVSCLSLTHMHATIRLAGSKKGKNGK